VEIETHSAVRNVMRLLERIKDYEKRVIARRGSLSRADMDALLAALTTLTQMLGPLAPHIAEELFEALGGEGTGAQTPWPRVSFKVAA
jgi:leucyl-tRNA synthetase